MLRANRAHRQGKKETAFRRRSITGSFIVRERLRAYIGGMVSRRILLAGLGAGLAAPRAGRAGPPRYESAWSETSHSAVRLILGGPGLAGLEFRLAPGFKTYWRDPGDSGVPPTFDWSGSDNLAGVEVVWPAPKRFVDGISFYIGYHGAPVFPLRLTPVDAGKPMRLRLRIDYAVCDTMCIPAQGAAELTAPPVSFDSPHATRLAAALARAPLRLAAGEAPPKGYAIGEVALVAGARPAVAVEIDMPRAATKVDLFIEGPRGSFFGKPEIVEAAGQPADATLVRRRFVAPIEQRAKHLPRWPLTLTFVSAGESLEFSTTIDAPR